MAVVLGDTAYARNLGQQYAKILAKRFRLNNMANRGYWINPGYADGCLAKMIMIVASL